MLFPPGIPAFIFCPEAGLRPGKRPAQSDLSFLHGIRPPEQAERIPVTFPGFFPAAPGKAASAQAAAPIGGTAARRRG